MGSPGTPLARKREENFSITLLIPSPALEAIPLTGVEPVLLAPEASALSVGRQGLRINSIAALFSLFFRPL